VLEGFAFLPLAEVRGHKREAGLLITIHANLAKPLWRVVVLTSIFSALSWVSTPSYAADPPSDSGYAFIAPVASSGWQIRFTPYAWAPSVDGDVTVRGHKADIGRPPPCRGPDRHT
jgi:hypothetical protein